MKVYGTKEKAMSGFGYTDNTVNTWDYINKNKEHHLVLNIFAIIYSALKLKRNLSYSRLLDAHPSTAYCHLLWMYIVNIQDKGQLSPFSVYTKPF